MTREELVKTIKTDGWNKTTKQLTREVFVNEPTNRFSFYDIYKIFHDDCCSVNDVVEAILNAPHFNKKNNYLFGVNNVVETDNSKMSRPFNDEEELIEFWCGTSKTRAIAFIENGNGYTGLECPVKLHNGSIVNYGIQVMLNDNRTFNYALNQAGAMADVPYEIHGYIKAKYLYPANNGYEYSIPCEYHKYIQSV